MSVYLFLCICSKFIQVIAGLFVSLHTGLFTRSVVPKLRVSLEPWCIPPIQYRTIDLTMFNIDDM